KLQNELQLRGNIDEQESALQGHIQAMDEHEKELEKRIIELNGENAWLRENNDTMVEQLDQSQSEIQRLKEESARLVAEIERSKAAAAETERQLEEARAEVERLKVEAANVHAAEVLEEVPLVSAVGEEAAPPPKPPFTGKAGKGLDIGTVNLVASEQNNDGET